MLWLVRVTAKLLEDILHRIVLAWMGRVVAWAWLGSSETAS